MSLQVFEQRLRAVLDVVNSYLPPHGVSAETAMTQIIDLVDPWPDGVTGTRQPPLPRDLEPTVPRTAGVAADGAEEDGNG
jgi:hypothetical protein